MRRAVLGIVAVAAALASGAAEACMGSVSPSLDNIAKADVVIRARVEARERGPDLCCIGVLGVGGKSEVLSFSVAKTFKGEAREEWQVIWLTNRRTLDRAQSTAARTKEFKEKGFPSQFILPRNLQIDPRPGDDVLAALYLPPFADDERHLGGMGEEGLALLNDQKSPILMVEYCVEGNAYLFPFNDEIEAKVRSILREKT